jgi:hypothetical protein
VLAALATWLTFGGPARSEANLAGTYPAQDVGDLQAFHELRQYGVLGSSPSRDAPS